MTPTIDTRGNIYTRRRAHHSHRLCMQFSDLIAACSLEGESTTCSVLGKVPTHHHVIGLAADPPVAAADPLVVGLAAAAVIGLYGVFGRGAAAVVGNRASGVLDPI
jgi:hypothetical protein